MVTTNVQSSAREVQDVLEERSVQGLGVIALSAAGGALLAQEVSERVLAAMGRPIDPSSPSDLGLSAISKTVLALALGVGAAQMTGLGLVVAAWLAVGSLVSAGVDLFDVLQRGGIPGSAPSQGYATETQQGGSGNAARTPATA